MIIWVPTPDGKMQMVTIDETPEYLVIVDTPTSSECIQQVEPTHTERVLGVHMAATDQMKTAYAYRLERVNVLQLGYDVLLSYALRLKQHIAIESQSPRTVSLSLPSQ